MTPRGQESFKFEDEPLPPELVRQGEIEKNDECQYCGNLFESESSCRVCANNKEKQDYLNVPKMEKAENKVVPISLTELETEIERLRKTRPELSKNNEALRILANINISGKKPSKLKPPEDPDYH